MCNYLQLNYVKNKKYSLNESRLFLEETSYTNSLTFP